MLLCLGRLDSLPFFYFVFGKIIYLFTFAATQGGLAHLARALAWQARGDRFESGNLHI